MVKNYNFRNQQKIKDEEINYLLRDLEKKIRRLQRSYRIKQRFKSIHRKSKTTFSTTAS